MSAMKQCQALRVLDALNRAGRSFLVERTPRGWRVELEQTWPHDGVSADGVSVTDALAQAAQVLTLDEDLEFQEEPIPDDVIPYALADVVEFATPMPDKEVGAVLLGIHPYCGSAAE